MNPIPESCRRHYRKTWRIKGTLWQDTERRVNRRANRKWVIHGYRGGSLLLFFTEICILMENGLQRGPLF